MGRNDTRGGLAEEIALFLASCRMIFNSNDEHSVRFRLISFTFRIHSCFGNSVGRVSGLLEPGCQPTWLDSITMQMKAMPTRDTARLC